MIFKHFILSDRQILQGEDGYHYDSKIMSQRGQDFDAVYNEIANNPEHEIVIQEAQEIQE
jgi:hypothetical protein